MHQCGVNTKKTYLEWNDVSSGVAGVETSVETSAAGKQKRKTGWQTRLTWAGRWINASDVEIQSAALFPSFVLLPHTRILHPHSQVIPASDASFSPFFFFILHSHSCSTHQHSAMAGGFWEKKTNLIFTMRSRLWALVYNRYRLTPVPGPCACAIKRVQQPHEPYTLGSATWPCTYSSSRLREQWTPPKKSLQKMNM